MSESKSNFFVDQTFTQETFQRGLILLLATIRENANFVAAPVTKVVKIPTP